MIHHPKPFGGGDPNGSALPAPLDPRPRLMARAPIGVPPRRINEIVLGKRAVTADTDLRLARYFSSSAIVCSIRSTASCTVAVSNAKRAPAAAKSSGSVAVPPRARASR